MLDSSISFGLQKKSSFIFGTGKIGSVYPINAYEKIVSTNKEFLKIENTTIKKSFNCQFSTSLFIEEANLIVGVSASKSEIFVFTLNDLNNPIIANFPTNQIGIFHIIYSKRSSVLLTFGFGVKIWNFNIKIPDRRRSTLKPTVNISFRYSFSGDDSTPIISPEVSNYEASIIISPSFDYANEIVFLPSSKGIIGYDMNGRQKVIMYRLPSSNKTTYCYYEDKQEMLVYDDTNGLILCTTSGFVQSRPLVGTTTIIWMDFLDSENALLMDAKGSFYILDLKTGRSFHCYSVLNSSSSATITATTNKTHQKNDTTFSMMSFLGPSNSLNGLSEINGTHNGLSNAKRMPSRVFLLRESREVCLCFGPRLETFKIDIPWRNWAVNISKTNALRRIEKPGEAARVLAYTSNSFVKILSPKDGHVLTDATPKSLSSPAGFFYDRGYLIYYQSKDDRKDDQNRLLMKKVFDTQTKERLFVLLEDGSISMFDADQNPCKEIGCAEMKVNSMTVCYFNNEFCYALSSLHSGEIYLVDTENVKKIKKKFLISHDNFCRMLFDPISVCLVCVMNRETILFDLQTQKVISRLPIKGTKLVELNDGVLYYGYENGDINFVKINTPSTDNCTGKSSLNNNNAVNNSTVNNNITDDCIEKSSLNNNMDDVSNGLNVKCLCLVSKEPNKLHFDSVTGFAFSQSFWVSVSVDQTVRYWDYSNSNFFTINMPCRLFGCEIINGKRDVVVGTDNELMLIEGETVFNGEIDEVDSVVDNFDNECDDFQKSLIENVMRMQREEEKREEERRNKIEQEEKEKMRKRQPLKEDKSHQKHKKLNLNREDLGNLHRLDLNKNSNIVSQKVDNDSEKVEDDSQKVVSQSEMTDEMKAILKEEEEKRRNKAYEAMMEITDRGRRYKEKALSKFNEDKSAKEKEKEKEKKKEKEKEKESKKDKVDNVVVVGGDNPKSNISDWSIKIGPNSGSDSLQSSRRMKKAAGKENEAAKSDRISVQVVSPSHSSNAESGNSESAHAPRRRKKKRVPHHHQDAASEQQQTNAKVEAPYQSQAKLSVQQEPESSVASSAASKSGTSFAYSENPPTIDPNGLVSTFSQPDTHPTESMDSTQNSNRSPLNYTNASVLTQPARDGAALPSQSPSILVSPSESVSSSVSASAASDAGSVLNAGYNDSLDLSFPQPPSAVTSAIRNKKYRTVANRNNIATSPIPDLSQENCDEEDQIATEKAPFLRPARAVKKKNSLSNSFNFFRRKNRMCRRAPTPPQVIRRSFVPKLNQRRRRLRSRSSNFTRKSGGFFEMPLPQFVLDIEAVKSQFGRGKVELLPLVQRIESDTFYMQRMNSKTSQQKDADDDREDDSLFNRSSSQFNSNELANSIGSANSMNETSPTVRPLIEQSKKTIFVPVASAKIGRNQSLGRIKQQHPSRVSRRPLGNYENSVTVVNSSDLTPRQLIPRKFSSVDNNANHDAKEKSKKKK